MTDNLNLTSETALKTIYTNLYPSLSEEHLPTSDPTPLEETHIDFINNPTVSAARQKFLASWKASVELETIYQAEVKKAQPTRLILTTIAQLEEDRKKAHKETTNNLNLYVYTVVKDKLEPPGGTLVTPESIQEATKTLKNYIKSLNGKEENVHSLIQLLHIVHGKQREFTTELIAVLQREALLQHVDLSKTNNDLLKDKESLVTKLKTAKKKLEGVREDNEKTEQLQKSYDLNIKLLADCDKHAEKLQNELKETKEFAAKLQATLDDNTQVDSLKQALQEKTELADQLKTALDSKQRENKAFEENSLEANHDLEESVKKHQEILHSYKDKYKTLEGEKAILQQELHSARQLNIQINETKNETQKSLNSISVQNRKQASKIKDLEIIQKNLKQKVDNLQLQIKDLEEREIVYRETEELYEQNFQEIADKTYDTTRFLEELKNSSINHELNSRGTQTTLDLQQILKQNNDQADLISVLQKKNSRLLNTRKRRLSVMGVGAGPGHGGGGNSNDDDDTVNLTGNQGQPADTTILDNVTKPIVKVLGELFSREDKKSIPTFKGKSTDKLITEWLKTAEHVARNNDWDEEQKLRFFSDRLKGEALEWHDEYVEEQDHLLNYTDWRKDIIERFRDSFDIATLKRKLQKLTQRPEESCRTFISRLRNLYESIEGKEDKPDSPNKSVVEDTLRQKVRKMRGEVLIKILLQGILPKFKTELYLRMPEDGNDFEALCKQLIISEQILQNKESNEDKELTAVIAGITHHVKQQDDGLTQQKLEIGNLKQKIAELEASSKRRHSAQEDLAIVAAVDHYDPRQTSSLDRHSRRDSKVRFTRPSSSLSRESSFSRQQGQNNSYSRSRDQSPAHYRENRFHSNKRLYSNDQGNERNQQPVQRYNRRQNQNNRNSYSNQFKWQSNNNGSREQADIQEQASFAQRDITCYNCGRRGHIARECWTDMDRANHNYDHDY
jgi:hypothetical protein